MLLFMVGGTNCSAREKHEATTWSAPPAANGWPIMALIDVIGMLYACRPKTAR